MTETPPLQGSTIDRLRRWLVWFSILVCGFLSAIHFLQPDWLAPVTMVPPWLWLTLGLIAIVVGHKSVSRTSAAFAIGLWILFGFLFAEETRSLLRFRSAKSNSVRIATLNCCIGSQKASFEPARFQPDVVFFQESLGPEPTTAVAEEYYGRGAFAVHGGDVSIISAARLEPVHVDPSSHFVHVVAFFEDGRKCDLVCLRLSPPVFQMDFLSEGFWVAHRDTRQHHRQQLKAIISHLDASAQTKHWIIGGDFNLVGNDGALSAFKGLHDTFYQAGSGICNTGTNAYPLFRVDQIWTTENVQCEMQKVHRTKHSDHRMVIVDLDF